MKENVKKKNSGNYCGNYFESPMILTVKNYTNKERIRNKPFMSQSIDPPGSIVYSSAIANSRA